jgi:hypothetical protein
MNFKEDTWYRVNGEDYKCLTVINTTVVLLKFSGMDEAPKIIKLSFDDIYNYKEISNIVNVVWSMYDQSDNQFMIEFAENFT